MRAPTQEEMFGPVVRSGGQRKPPRPLKRQRVFDAIRAAGPNGATVDELEKALRLTHQTASARVHELMRAGSIEPHPELRRPTRSGRKAHVWILTGVR